MAAVSVAAAAAAAAFCVCAHTRAMGCGRPRRGGAPAAVVARAVCGVVAGPAFARLAQEVLRGDDGVLRAQRLAVRAGALDPQHARRQPVAPARQTGTRVVVHHGVEIEHALGRRLAQARAVEDHRGRRAAHFADALAQSHKQIVLAWLNEEAVGAIHWESTRLDASDFYLIDRPILWVESLVVRADMRRRGIARALVDLARQVADVQGIAEIALEVWAFNEEAERAFTALGLMPHARTMIGRTR